MPGFESLSPTIVVWVFLVLMLAGLVQGALGLGFPIVATPLIAAVTDMQHRGDPGAAAMPCVHRGPTSCAAVT